MKERLKLFIWLVSLTLLMSCDNQHDDGARRFCENEQKLLVPNSIDTIDWDLDLSMAELYISAVTQAGEDTCSGGRVYTSRIDLSDKNYVFLRTEIANSNCPCCPQRPPGLRPRILTINVVNDSLTSINLEIINNTKLDSALSDWTSQSWLSIQNRYLLFELQWSEEVSEQTLQTHIITMIESYFNFLKTRSDLVKGDICAQDFKLDLEEMRLPQFLLIIELYLPPPPLPKDSVNLD